MLPALVSIRKPACPTLVTCTNTLSLDGDTGSSLAGRDVARVPQPPVVVDASPVRIHTVGVEQLAFPRRRGSSTTATAWRPPGRPTDRRRRGLRGRRARWKRPSSSINVLGAHASPWQTTSRSIGGESVTHGGGPNGQSSSGSRSCSTRNPTPIARAAVRGSATQCGSTAERPGNPAVCSHPSPAPSTCGTRTCACRPAQPFGLGDQMVCPHAAETP